MKPQEYQAEETVDKNFIFVLIICFIAASMEASICYPILKEMMLGLSTNYHFTQMIMSVNFLSLSVVGLVVGYISDCFAPVKLLSYGMLGLTLSSLGCFLSQDIISMLLFRSMQGAFSAFPIVICSSLMIKLYSVERSAKLLSFANSVSTLSLIVAPLIGTVMTYFFGWRSVFIITALVSLLGLIGILKYQRCFIFKEKYIVANISYKQFIKNMSTILKNKVYLSYGLSWSIICSIIFIYFAKLPFIEIKSDSYIFNGIAQTIIMIFFVISSFLCSKYISISTIKTVEKAGWILIGLGVLIFTSNLLYPSFNTMHAGIALFAIGNAFLIGILPPYSLSNLQYLKGTGTAILQSIRYFIMIITLHISFFESNLINIVVLVLFLPLIAYTLYLFGNYFTTCYIKK